MPVPIAPNDPNDPTVEISKQLKRLAKAVDGIQKGGGGGHKQSTKASLQGIAGNVSKTAKALEDGTSGGGVTDANYTDMADALQAVADQLRP